MLLEPLLPPELPELPEPDVEESEEPEDPEELPLSMPELPELPDVPLLSVPLEEDPDDFFFVLLVSVELLPDVSEEPLMPEEPLVPEELLAPEVSELLPEEPEDPPLMPLLPDMPDEPELPPEPEVCATATAAPSDDMRTAINSFFIVCLHWQVFRGFFQGAERTSDFRNQAPNIGLDVVRNSR